MKITLNVKLSDGTVQQHSYDLPPGVSVSGYSVDVDQVDQVDRTADIIRRNATYGKTGAGKSAVAQYGVSAVMAAAICGCMDPSRHVGGIDRGAVPDPGAKVFLFTPRTSPNWPPTWPPRTP